MLFKRRKSDTASEHAGETTSAAELAAALINAAGYRTAIAGNYDSAGEALGSAAGWRAAGRPSAVLLTDLELGQVNAQVGELVDRRIPLLVVVLVRGSLDSAFRAGRAGAAVMLSGGPSESSALIRAALLASARVSVPVIAVIPDLPGPGSTVDPTPVTGTEPILDVNRPSGTAALPAGVRGAVAEHAYLRGPLGEVLDTCLSDAGLDTLTSAHGRGPRAIGWILQDPPARAIASPRRLFPVPDLGLQRPAVQYWPAHPDLILAWSAEAGLAGTPICVHENGAIPPATWRDLLKDAASGGLPPVSFLSDWGHWDQPDLPPEIQERNRRSSERLGATLRGVGEGADLSGVGRVDEASDRLPSGLRGGEDLEVFWRRDGYLRRSGRSQNLLPDEWDSRGRVPPGTSAAILPAPDRSQAPQVSPRACTACGQCWALCPEIAIRARVVRFDRILADRISKSHPLPVRLPRLVRPLGTLCSRLFRDDGLGQYPDLDVLAAEALERLLVKTDLSEEEQDEARRELTDLKLPALPLIPAFDDPERALYLGIDPDRCTGCGLCAEACPDNAISMVEGDAVFDLFDPGVPELGSSEIEVLAAQNPAAALAGEPRAVFPSRGPVGTTVALHQTLGALARPEAAFLTQAGEHIRALRQALETAAQTTLSAAAKIHDFDALAARLDEIESGSVDQAASLGQAPPLETKRFRALTEARDRLKGLAPVGRAPLTLVTSGDLPLPAYPENAFAFPWLHVSSQVAAFARGVLDENMRAAREVASAIVAVEPLAGTGRSLGNVDALTRGLTPRLVILCTDLDGEMMDLLSEDLPVTVVLLAGRPLSAGDQALSVAVAGRCPVAQVSPAEPDHLVESLQALSLNSGASLVSVHVSGAPAEFLLRDLRSAVDSGVWPLFRSSPEGAVMVHRPDTSSASSVLDWMTRQAHYSECFEVRFAHATPDDGIPASRWEEGASGTPYVKLDDRRIAVPDEVAVRQARRIRRLQDRIASLAVQSGPSSSDPAALATASAAPTTPRDGATTAGSSAEQASGPAPQDAEVEPLQDLATRLLHLSGFGPGGSAASRRLGEFVEPNRSES